MTLLDLQCPQPSQRRPWLKALALAGKQTPASCPRTVMCQWRQAAAVAVVHALAQALVAAQAPEQAVPAVEVAQVLAAVAASQPAPWAAIKSNHAIRNLPGGRELKAPCS